MTPLRAARVALHDSAVRQPYSCYTTYMHMRVQVWLGGGGNNLTVIQVSHPDVNKGPTRGMT